MEVDFNLLFPKRFILARKERKDRGGGLILPVSDKLKLHELLVDDRFLQTVYKRRNFIKECLPNRLMIYYPLKSVELLNI